MNIYSVVAPAYGGPEVLSVVESTRKDPEPGQVLIDVRAVGTNPVDFKIYGGPFGTDPSKLPLPLGFEASGIVVDVGGKAEGPCGPISIGDEVIAYRVSGAYTNGLLTPASTVLAKPSMMSFEEASGLMLAGVTALHALQATGTSSGDTLLVNGVAGGVGLMAAQIAIADGVRVVGTASKAQHEMLRGLGVEPVAYGDGLLERIHEIAPHGITSAIDLVGNDEALDTSLTLVANRERIATIVPSPQSREKGVLALGNGPGADPGVEIRSAGRLELIRRVEAGSLKVFIAATYPLRDAAAGHRHLATGHAHGKVILVP